MSSALRLALLIVVAALLAFGARAMFINSQRAQAPKDPDVMVWVANDDLPVGLLLRDGDTVLKAIPLSKVPRNAITEKSSQDLAHGALLRTAISADSIIKTSDIISANAPGFLAAVLKPGMRAVSVQVDDVSGNAGLIQPGDYVDMILTQRLTEDNGLEIIEKQIVSETVVERARIIAVGSSFQRQSEKSGPIRARTVTIEVQPRAAEAVTVATRLGTISLALRSFATNERGADATATSNDGALVVAWQGVDTESNTGPVWGSDVSRVLNKQNAQITKRSSENNSSAAKPESKESKPQQRQITLFRGGSTTVITNNFPDVTNDGNDNRSENESNGIDDNQTTQN